MIPFENFVGNDEAISYIAIRADEPTRTGYISKKSNITTCFPFKEDGIAKEEVTKILESSGLGLPEYYKWRSRSGCYFCFFQRQEEWLGLQKNHPDLFEKSKQYEKTDEISGKRYTWNQEGSLDEIMEKPVTSTFIPKKPKSKKLIDNISSDDDGEGCIICML